MFHFIKGILATEFEEGVVIETNGIGYEVYVPSNSSVYLAKEGQEVMLYTLMIVREDDVKIYGFADKESLKLFKLLMTVNGVGAKAAMAILSVLSYQELQKSIIYEDVAMITRANGVGKKIAQRIVLELKEKIDPVAAIGGKETVALSGASKGKNTEKSEALNALIALGYSKSEGIDALARIDDKGLSTEEYVKKALKSLM